MILAEAKPTKAFWRMDLTIFLFISGTLAATSHVGDSRPRLSLGKTGIVQAEHADTFLSVPTLCHFLDTGETEYWYQSFLVDDEISACIAGPTKRVADGFCDSDDYWPIRDMVDGDHAVKNQIPKDGIFTSSTKGHWEASWLLGTTAVPDADTYYETFIYAWLWLPVCHTVPECNKQCRRFYFNYKGDVSRTYDSTFQLRQLIKHQRLRVAHETGPIFNPYQYCP